MEILIVGQSGSGKSVLGDLIRNAIFRADRDSKITTDDADRQTKALGSGKTPYNLHIRQLKAGETIRGLSEIDLNRFDIIIGVKGGGFIKRYREISE